MALSGVVICLHDMRAHSLDNLCECHDCVTACVMRLYRTRYPSNASPLTLALTLSHSSSRTHPRPRASKGSGTLGLPYAMAQLGWYSGIGACVVFGLAAIYSGLLLASVRNRFCPDAETYSEVAADVIGSRFSTFTQVGRPGNAPQRATCLSVS